MKTKAFYNYLSKAAEGKLPQGVTPQMFWELVDIYNGTASTTISRKVAEVARSFGVKTTPQGIGWKLEARR